MSRFFCFLSILLSVFFFHPLKVDAQEIWGSEIQSIQVRGLKQIEKQAVLKKLSFRKGSLLQKNMLQRDLKKLFSMRYFQDISFWAKTLPSGKIQLVIRVKEQPVIAELHFEGNEQVSTDDLVEVIQTREWMLLDKARLKEDVEKIQKHYQEKGYYLSKARYEVTPLKKGEVKVTFYIQDYEKVQIQSLTFLNNKAFSDQVLKKIFQETQEGGGISFLSSGGDFKENGFRRDLKRLVYWYLDHGYVKFRYDPPVVTVSEDKKWVFVSIAVDEGQAYKVGNIGFGGDLLFSKEQLSEDLELEQGDLFQITKRNRDILKLSEKYQDLGYAFVNVIPKMQIHDKNKTVDITYEFEKGPLVHIGEIRILGNAKTHDKVIRRELKVYEGELFNGTGLRKSRERVERLGFFEPGQVVFRQIPRKSQPDIVDIEIEVKEASTGTLTIGAGYGTVQKFFFSAQVAERNLFGRGQALSLQAQWAADRISRSLSLSFTDPYAFNTHWSLGLDLFSVHFPIPNRYTMSKQGFSTRLGRPITDDINIYFTYRLEDVKVSAKVDPTEDTSGDEGLLSSVRWTVIRDLRNNRFQPSKGNYQSFSLETAGIGGDKYFLKWDFNFRFYTPVIGDLVFRHSLEYGHIAPLAGRPVPVSERFLLGGPNNLRGYDYYSVGPSIVNTDGTLRPLGGLVQLFGLFELEYPLIREAGLKWVLFYDVGNAFSYFPGTKGEPWTFRQDVGFGLRWFSPIGPLRFEWGFPLRKKPLERTPVFQFFIGTPF